jgi:hypothetical protein
MWSPSTIKSSVRKCSSPEKRESKASGEAPGGNNPAIERKGEVAHKVGHGQRSSE